MVVKAGRFTLNGLSVRHNQGTGIWLGEGARDYVITGCRIHNNGTGASLRGEKGIVSNNIFTDNGRHLIDGEADKRINGNLFSGENRPVKSQ